MLDSTLLLLLKFCDKNAILNCQPSMFYSASEHINKGKTKQNTVNFGNSVGTLLLEKMYRILWKNNSAFEFQQEIYDWERSEEEISLIEVFGNEAKILPNLCFPELSKA